MELQSGGPVTLCDAPNSRGGSWSPAGFILFAPNIQTPIMKVAETGGTAVPVTTLRAGETTQRWPQLLPDGKHFLYFATSHSTQGLNDEGGVYWGSLEGGAAVRLLHIPDAAVFASGKLLFLRGTTLMAQNLNIRHGTLEGDPVLIASDVAYDAGIWRGIFSTSENGMLIYSGGDPTSHHLQWYSSSGQMENGTSNPGNYYSTALSPKGTRLAEAPDPQADLWVVELNGKGRIRISSARTSNPVWSPDESRIVYSRTDEVGGLPQIVMRASDGSGEERIAAAEPVWQQPSDWSHDGRYILYDRGNPGSSHVWAVPLANGGKPFPVAQTESWDHEGRFSPDGKWIAFTSRESSIDQVYITAFPAAGTKWQVSAQGGCGARWSPDGKWIYFWNPAHNVLSKASVSFRGPTAVIGSETRVVNGSVFHNPGFGWRLFDRTGWAPADQPRCRAKLTIYFGY